MSRTAVMAEHRDSTANTVCPIRGRALAAASDPTDELKARTEYVCPEILGAVSNVPLQRQPSVPHLDHSDILQVSGRKTEDPFMKFGGMKFLEAGHITRTDGDPRGPKPAAIPPAFRTLASCCPAGGGPTRAKQ